MPIPSDPVLAELLASGGFETLLRIIAQGSGTDSPGSTIRLRFPDLSAASVAYLQGKIESAIDAAETFGTLFEGERLSLSMLPRVPTQGTPGTPPGTVVVISKAYGYGLGPKGSDVAHNYTTVYGVSPTKADFIEAAKDKLNEDKQKYERLQAWIDAHQDEIIDDISAAFVVE